MAIDKYAKIAIANEFFDWLEEQYGMDCVVHESWVDRWAAETFVECDTACAFGPGHQSTSECIVTQRGHAYHVDKYGHEWEDEDLTDATYQKTRPIPPTDPDSVPMFKWQKEIIGTYRLFFEPY